MNIGVKGKIIVVNGIIIFFIMLIFGYIFYYNVRNSLFDEVDKGLAQSAELLKKSIQKKFTPVDFYFRDFKYIIPDDMSVAMANESGEIIYRNKFFISINLKSEERQKIGSSTSMFKIIEQNRVIIHQYDFYGENNYIIISKDISKLKQILNGVIFNYLWIMALLFSLSVLFSVLNLNNILKSITRITELTQKIKEDNLEYRIEESYNTKEIDTLVETINTMLDGIEQGFSRVKDFTSDVSHELKTPLTSMKNMLEVELIKNRSVEEYQDVMGTVLEDLGWLSGIINELLLITRLETDRVELKKEDINLKDIINDVIELMEIFAIEKDIRIDLTIKEDIFIKGDSSMLRRLMLNFISNGIKYNKDGGILSITLEKIEDGVRMIFSDTGIGIKKENLNKIFERFYREDKVRTSKQSGTGLGLAIVEYIIKMYNGNINVKSEEGIGTEFTIELFNPINTK